MKINLKSQKDNKWFIQAICLSERATYHSFSCRPPDEYKTTCCLGITNAANHSFVGVNTDCHYCIWLADILWFRDVEEEAHWSDCLRDRSFSDSLLWHSGCNAQKVGTIYLSFRDETAQI